MKVEQFNKQTLGHLRIEIQNALNEVAKRNGLNSIQIGNISYNHQGTSFTTKLEARTIAKAVDPAFIKLQKSLCVRLGLPENALGQQFTSLGRTFQIDRIDAKKWKSPIIAKEVVNGEVTDKGFKFQVEPIKRHFLQNGSLGA